MFNDAPEFPSSVNRRCPAIILAVNRMAKVPGRIRFLVVSIITRNGKSKLGAPCGTKWANIWVVLLIHPKIINLIHIGSLSARVNTICLDLVKIYGNSPKKLFIIIKVNNLVNNRVPPLFVDDLIRILNSLCMVEIKFIHNKFHREGISQKIEGRLNINIDLIQFKEKDEIEDGSNEENRFVIIFKI